MHNPPPVRGQGIGWSCTNWDRPGYEVTAVSLLKISDSAFASLSIFAVDEFCNGEYPSPQRRLGTEGWTLPVSPRN
eukprot:gene1469-5975_t